VQVHFSSRFFKKLVYFAGVKDDKGAKACHRFLFFLLVYFFGCAHRR
jgi:hypothetical protein